MACQGAMGLFRAAPYAPWRPPPPRRFRALPGPKNPNDRADGSPSRSACVSQHCASCRRSERREERITGCGQVTFCKRHTPRRLALPMGELSPQVTERAFRAACPLRPHFAWPPAQVASTACSPLWLQTAHWAVCLTRRAPSFRHFLRAAACPVWPYMVIF